MLELYKRLITDQYEAALRMLSDAIELCPDDLWHQPVVELKFCQAAFHALFYTDVYLGWTYAELQEQEFHRRHAQVFADYEEVKPVRQKQECEKQFINDYVQHCRQKVERVMTEETAESLAHAPGFEWLQFSRAEVHVYNIRHIHHHAAQLSLHLRSHIGQGVDWQSSGWERRRRPANG